MAEKKPAASKPDAADMPLEAAIGRLEEIVAQLESGDADLERSIELFQEGKKLGTQALKKLSALERRVRVVIDGDGDELKTAEFDEGEA